MAANVYGLIFEIDDKTKSGARSIGNNLNKIQSGADKAKRALGGIGSAAGKAVGVLGKTAAAATAAAGAFAFLAKKNLDALDALGKTASKLGVSTKFLSSYSLVANKAGISTDQFNTGLQRFLRRLGQAQQGTGELVKPLKQLGVSMTDANGNFRDGTDVFNDFISKLGGTSNEAQKLALAMGAFDTEGVAFINIANMGADAIGRIRKEAQLAGLVIGQDMADGAARANDAITSLLARARGFGLQFFGSLAPGIETLADDITKAVDGAIADAGGIEAFSRELASKFVASTADFIDTLAMLFDGFTNTMNTFTNVLKNILASLPASVVGKDYEMGSVSQLGHRKATIQAEIDMLKAVINDQSYGDIALGAVPFIGKFISTAVGAQDQIMFLEAELAKVDKTLANVADGSVVFLNELSTNSTSAQDAVAGTTDKLREMGDTLATNTQLQKDQATATEGASESVSALSAAAQAYLTNIIEPNNQLLGTFDEQRDKLDVLVERYMHLDDQASSSGNNANLAMKQLAAEILATSGSLNNLSAEMKKAVGGVFIDQTVGNAKQRFNQLTLEVDSLEAELAAYNKTIFDSFRETDAFKVVIQALEGALASAKGELRGLTGEMLTLSELEGQVAKSTKADADAMALYTEYVNGAKRSVEELAAARAVLGIAAPTKTTTTPEVDPITSFDDYYDGLANSAINAANEIGYAERAQKRLKAALDAGKISAGAFDIAMQKTNETLGNSNPYIDNIESAIKGLSGSIASNFTDVIFGLKSGFDALQDIALNVLQTIIQTMIQTFIQQQMMKMSFSSLGGLGGLGMLGGFGILGGIGMLLGGMFADGGSTARAGQKPIMVGERGPEVFMPGKAGTVVANEELNSIGGSGDLSVNFTINAIDTRTGVEFLLQNKRVITGVIQEAYQRRGTQGPLG